MALLDASPTLVDRPQPVGIADLPAGYLVVPDVPGGEDVRSALLRGDLPPSWPAGCGFIDRALAGDVDGARLALADASDRLAPVNRFALAPSLDAYTSLRPGLAGEAAALVDVVAFTVGLLDDPPDGEGLEGEFAALVLTAQASAALEAGDVAMATELLRAAVASARPVSPALAGRTLGTLAETVHHRAGPSSEVLAWYDEAIDLLAGDAVVEVRAGLQLQRAVASHVLADGERVRLLEAVRHYEAALQVFTEQRHPDAFAFANANLALALLALPATQASDQIRLGVAVQSLRAALRVYRPETHPGRWASTQLNLANALQYLPSRHREDNLAESVTLYEELLGVRSEGRDPLGYARVLANQANALAHLGIFEHAVPKLEEARAVFARNGDPDAVAAVDAHLTEIAAHRDAEQDR